MLLLKTLPLSGNTQIGNSNLFTLMAGQNPRALKMTITLKIPTTTTLCHFVPASFFPYTPGLQSRVSQTPQIIKTYSCICEYFPTKYFERKWGKIIC